MAVVWQCLHYDLFLVSRDFLGWMQLGWVSNAYSMTVIFMLNLLHVLVDLLEEAPPVEKCMVVVSGWCLRVQLLQQRTSNTFLYNSISTCIFFLDVIKLRCSFRPLQDGGFLLFMWLHSLCCNDDCHFFWEVRNWVCIISRVITV